MALCCVVSRGGCVRVMSAVAAVLVAYRALCGVSVCLLYIGLNGVMWCGLAYWGYVALCNACLSCLCEPVCCDQVLCLAYLLQQHGLLVVRVGRCYVV